MKKDLVVQGYIRDSTTQLCIYIYRDYDRPLSGFLFTKHDFTKNKAVLFRGSFLTGIFHPKKGQQMMENTPIPEDVFVGKHLFKVILTHHKKCQ